MRWLRQIVVFLTAVFVQRLLIVVTAAVAFAVPLGAGWLLIYLLDASHGWFVLLVPLSLLVAFPIARCHAWLADDGLVEHVAERIDSWESRRGAPWSDRR